MLIGVGPLSDIEYHTSGMIPIMTIINGSSSLFASVLGAGLYMLLADALPAIMPRWLLILGLVLITVAPEAHDLGVSYGKFVALAEVDLTVRKNSLHSIIGPTARARPRCFMR